jgi:hypothetical protein
MDYENAREFYRVARDQQGYSNAFWEVRNTFYLVVVVFIVTLMLGFDCIFTLSIVSHIYLKLCSKNQFKIKDI